MLTAFQNNIDRQKRTKIEKKNFWEKKSSRIVETPVCKKIFQCKNLVHFWQTRVFWKADSKLYLTDVLHFGEKAEKPVKIGANCKKEVF